ncbi:MAG: TIGR03960 family B12-binding radical SAM protein [Clostridiaceae bacterium]|nr:TIGR03960 family B12-binding radical SAM protein [Clostridiaceae bacterium]
MNENNSIHRVELSRGDLLSVENPARYVGGEWGEVIKSEMLRQLREEGTTSYLRFALCFPDIYEIAMSNLAMKILYKILNDIDGVACERAFSPWKDMDRLMRDKALPLFTLETRSPLNDFDVLGFSLQYEMCFTNVFQMLDLSGISFRASERSESDPIVVAGGPVVYNIEPIAEVFDLVFLGEGEEVLAEFMDLMKIYKASARTNEPMSKASLLKEASKLEGVYVPSYYSMDYNTDGTIKSIDTLVEWAPKSVRKRIISNLDCVDFPTNPVVPHTKIVHDRAYLELFRGCSRGCRFCQAGYVYRPVREKSIETLCGQGYELEAATGYDEIGVLSLSTSDYSSLPEFLDIMVEPFADRHTSLSLPSLRLDSFSLELMEKVSGTRKTGLTFAPEAGTQRLRDVINKGITEEDIMSSLELAFAGGWQRVKLYFMLGLPTETMEDVLGIAQIARRVEKLFFEVANREGLKRRKPEIVVSTSMFIPKPFTPFQWEAQDTIESLRDKQKVLAEALKSRNIKYSWHDLKTSVWEALLARGDRRLLDVLTDGYRQGLYFDAWDDCFRYEDWLRVLESHGLSLDFFGARSRGEEEILPWDHIDIGVRKSYLFHERAMAYQEKTTAPCHGGCRACGAAEYNTGVCHA